MKRESEILIHSSYVFLECRILLCDFHREQAWGRWLSATKNEMRSKKKEALSFLRTIAFSNTHEEYLENLSKLQNSTLWIDEKSNHFRNWIGKTWLPLYQVCSL